MKSVLTNAHPKSQAHWQVAQADAQPKPTKELVLPTHMETVDNKARNANKVSYVMRGKVVNLGVSTFNKRCSGLIVRSFETRTTHTLGRCVALKTTVLK